MGSKGTTTNTTQSQNQTYTPAGYGYIQNALQQGQNAAQTPFSAPVAPVAGFSQDQQSAFQNVRNAQGMAQPYINQAQNYFSPQGAQSFLNPYADNVMAGLKDVFGQQQSQQTGQLTQAAGGVGADRIAVGQADLAKQQGLAAGQTLSGLYSQAVNQAQSAGYGTAALGSQAQNAALSGAQAQLGVGGLQQQLQQAQLNAPYQQQLAQLAYPFQTAQFNAGITGALAPGLGGNTQGYGAGTSTPPPPSLWSQILGGGAAITGGLGATGAFGNNGWMTGGKGSGTGTGTGNGSWYGPSSVGGAPLSGYSGVSPGAARGGRIDPYAFDGGGAVSDDPIDISSPSIVPEEKLTPIQANMPQLNLSPPQQQSGGSSGGKGGPGIGDIAKIAMMFAKRGGRIELPGYAGGGTPGEDDSPASFDERFPYRSPNSEAMDAWRDGASQDMAFSAPDTATSTPAARAIKSAVRDAPAASPYAPSQAAAAEETPSSDSKSFASSPWLALMSAGLGAMSGTSPYAGVNIGAGGLQGLKTLESQRAASQKDTTIAQSAKRLEQEAKFHEDQYTRMTPAQKATLEQAKLPYEQMTAAQKATHDLAVTKQHTEEMKPVQIGIDDHYQPIYARRNAATGEYEIIDPAKLQGKTPAAPPASAAPPPAPSAPPASPSTPAATAAPAAIPVKAESNGLPEKGEFTNDAVVLPSANPAVLESIARPAERERVKAIAEGRAAPLPTGNPRNFQNKFIMDKVYEYDPGFDATAFSRRQRTANFFAVGTQGGGGQNITAMNTFGQHAEELAKLSEKMNLGRFTNWNDFKNAMAKRGYGKKETQDLIGQWEVAQAGVAGEAAKVFAGTNTALADREHWQNIFNANTPAATMKAKLAETVKLVEGRLNSLTSQYNQGMRTNHDPQDMVAKKTREVFAKLKSEGGGNKPDAATRFKELTAGGMSASDAYKKLHDEGF